MLQNLCRLSRCAVFVFSIASVFGLSAYGGEIKTPTDPLIEKLKNTPAYFGLNGDLTRSRAEQFCHLTFTSFPYKGRGGFSADMDASYPFTNQSLCVPGTPHDAADPLPIDFSQIPSGTRLIQSKAISSYGNGDEFKSRPALALDVEAVAGREVVSLALLKATTRAEAERQCPAYSGTRWLAHLESDGSIKRASLTGWTQPGDDFYDPFRQAPQTQDFWGALLNQATESFFSRRTGQISPTPVEMRFLPSIDSHHHYYGACQEGFTEVLLTPPGAMYTHTPGKNFLEYDEAHPPQCEFGGWFQSYFWKTGLPVVALDGSDQGLPADTNFICMRFYETEVTPHLQAVIDVPSLIHSGEITFVHNHHNPRDVKVIEGPVDRSIYTTGLSAITFEITDAP